MFGTGTIINTVAILAGGFFGRLVGGRLKERFQETMTIACGVSTIFIGISGALEKMLVVENGTVSSGKAMMIVICMALGGLIGEWINLDGLFERFGSWLKIKSGNAKDPKFVDGFLTTSFTVCIGAMAIVGSIEDGLTGDYSILATKSILDLIFVTIMTCSLGKGCVYSAIPVFAIQGGVTLLSQVIKPIMTPEALANLSLLGSVLIFCVGVNLVFNRKIRVANLLPAIVFAVLAAFLPITL